MELMEKLIDAYSNSDWEHHYYLDIESGNVVMDLDESIFAEPESEWDENTDIDRYLEIPRATSTDSMHLMQQFAKQIDDEKTGKTLLDAFERSEKEFVDSLSELNLTDKWTAFRVAYYKEQVLDWLDIEELSYDELVNKGK